MTRPDRRYVAGRAHDLVGLRGVRHPEVDAPEGRPTAGVTARLALVWACQQEPVLMCGTIAQKAPASIAKARHLVETGVVAWEELDLRADLGLPVRCGKMTHSVVLRADGGFETPSHPGLDVEAEQVAASFGAPMLPCLVEIDAAAGPHRPPSQDNGVRRPPVCAGELFWFLRTCRSWLEAGHDLGEATGALQIGLSELDLRGHLDAGLSVTAALAWRDVLPDEAALWAALGFGPADRRTWEAADHSFEEAEVAVRSVGGDVHRLVRWAGVAGAQVSPEETAAWARWGAPVGVWGEVARLGLPVAEVGRWQAALNPVEIHCYVQHRVSLEEALRWKEAGWSAYVATGFLSLGVSLEQAWEMRSYPARQVQELWPRVRSVAGVLATLGIP